MSFQKIIQNEADYPRLLKEIHSSPESLWIEGDAACLSEGTLIAVVGARECTDYGRDVAFRLAKELAQAGVTVVSGMAYGIDTAAHEGALAGGGKTIAVLGSGLNQTYPAGNRDLRKRIAKQGAVVSEFSPDTEGSSWTFPRRNRVISGLSHGVVVVEAGLKSGSLITARHALAQNREVFAVPGNILSPLSEGTHALIQKGAKLIQKVQDILEELPAAIQTELPLLAEEDIHCPNERQVLSLLRQGPRHVEELLQGVELSVEKTSALLVELELGGKIRLLPGGRYTA